MANNMSDYINARKLGIKEYSKYISMGQNGYLPFLDGVLKNIDIVSEVDLGINDIPLRKIKGTYSYLRSISFARNYMPLMEQDSEFADKWQNVCNIQYKEGLRDPVKVYEYLNWFYIVEGNKRASVLKYLDVYSYPAEITRLIPRYDENNKDIKIYYEFMDFNKKTGIFDIWVSKEKGFKELWELIKDYEPSTKYSASNERFKYFLSAVYNMFRKVYYKHGGNNLPITTGDAFLDFIKIHGIDDNIPEKELQQKVKKLIAELKSYSMAESIEVQRIPRFKSEQGIIGRITQRTKTEKIKVGFVHASEKNKSSWTYSHELGRMHLKNALKDQVVTVAKKNVPENLEAVPIIQDLVNSGCRIIFTTTPPLINATLKVAMENPECNFLNCSCVYSFKHVNTYFGRIHEPRFLSGIAAGALTKTNKLGYIAPLPTPDILSGLNAFALGVRMVNPKAEIFIKWNLSWQIKENIRELTGDLVSKGVDIISHNNTISTREFTPEYGVYTLKKDESGSYVPDKYLAAPVWNWGIFYEKYVRSVISGATKLGADSSTSGRIRNFWWGMDSGLLDFFYAHDLPSQTIKMIEFFKSSIISQNYNVFSGPIFDNMGRSIIGNGEELLREQILSMNWLAEGITGELPDMEDYPSGQVLSTGKIV